MLIEPQGKPLRLSQFSPFRNITEHITRQNESLAPKQETCMGTVETWMLAPEQFPT